MKLTQLQKLAEGASQDAYGKVNKIFDPLHDKLEALHDAAEFIRKQLQSSVLNDVLKQEGFPATEAKAAKDAAQAAFKAIQDLEDEISQLHQAIGTHFDTGLNESNGKKTFKVMFKYDDPSGSGRATTSLTYDALVDKSHARRVFDAKLNKAKFKNAKIIRVTEVE